MCEEFHCLPSAALREAAAAPAGLLDDIIDYRQLARAIAIYERDPTVDDPTVQFIKTIDFEMAAESLAHE